MEFEATVAGRRLRVRVSGGDGRYRVRVGERELELDHDATRPHLPSLLLEGVSRQPGLAREGDAWRVALGAADLEIAFADALPAGLRGSDAPAANGPARVRAPMPGKIVRLLVELGQQVEAGQGLMVMEAMKMENELRAPRAGRLAELGVQQGQTVETGALLALLE